MVRTYPSPFAGDANGVAAGIALAATTQPQFLAPHGHGVYQIKQVTVGNGSRLSHLDGAIQPYNRRGETVPAESESAQDLLSIGRQRFALDLHVATDYFDQKQLSIGPPGAITRPFKLLLLEGWIAGRRRNDDQPISPPVVVQWALP